MSGLGPEMVGSGSLDGVRLHRNDGTVVVMGQTHKARLVVVGGAHVGGGGTVAVGGHGGGGGHGGEEGNLPKEKQKSVLMTVKSLCQKEKRVLLYVVCLKLFVRL